jgi:hypothetical protein
MKNHKPWGTWNQEEASPPRVFVVLCGGKQKEMWWWSLWLPHHWLVWLDFRCVRILGSGLGVGVTKMSKIQPWLACFLFFLDIFKQTLALADMSCMSVALRGGLNSFFGTIHGGTFLPLFLCPNILLSFFEDVVPFSSCLLLIDAVPCCCNCKLSELLGTTLKKDVVHIVVDCVMCCCNCKLSSEGGLGKMKKHIVHC